MQSSFGSDVLFFTIASPPIADVFRGVAGDPEAKGNVEEFVIGEEREH